MARREETDFARDVPAELMVSPGEMDAFMKRGHVSLFIALIGDTAANLLFDPSTAEYQETFSWASDPKNLECWLTLVGGSEHLVPTLQDALLQRPALLKKACQDALRSQAQNGGDFERFMEAMGMQPVSQGSSLNFSPQDDIMESAYAYS